ncbi:MAG TPA: Fe-Mn family superoxide dismutase [Patescibacteria group bacterium]|nr:Fe-Mn family superoxide dismutase [Patescibacteria group bacterium]
MTYAPKNYEHLIGIHGFSENLLRNHFTLYEGYVKSTNILMEKIAATEQGTPEYAELKRRFGWEFNGMRLHEYYFDNMTKETAAPPNAGTLLEKITEYFGSVESWEKDFKTTGLMRGIGWVILYHDTRAGKLFNVWVNEHDLGHLAGATPLLVMDVFEHAFVLDYGLQRAAYIEAFWKAIKWAEVEKRFAAV